MPRAKATDGERTQEEKILQKIAELQEQLKAVRAPANRTVVTPSEKAHFADLSLSPSPETQPSASRKRKVDTPRSVSSKKQKSSSRSSVVVPAGSFVGVQVPPKTPPKGVAGGSESGVTPVPDTRAPPLCVRCVPLGGFRGDALHRCDRLPGGRACGLCREKKLKCNEIPVSLWKPADALVRVTATAHSTMDDVDIASAKMEGNQLAHRLRQRLQDLSGVEGIKRKLDEVVSAPRLLVSLKLQDRGIDPGTADDTFPTKHPEHSEKILRRREGVRKEGQGERMGEGIGFSREGVKEEIHSAGSKGKNVDDLAHNGSTVGGLSSHTSTQHNS